MSPPKVGEYIFRCGKPKTARPLLSILQLQGAREPVTDPRIQSEHPKEVTALSKEVSEFLLEFSIGVHRHSMYPPDHPSLVPTAENILGCLSAILMERTRLTLGVGRDQLIIEGVATESKHPVLRDLAKRLHDHQVGAVSFDRGATRSEIEGLLETVSRDPDREGDPIGLLPTDQIPSWEHIQIFPLGYDGLELTEDGDPSDVGPDRATDLWLGLARAAMGSDVELETGGGGPDGTMVANAIRKSRRDAAYDEIIAGYLGQLAEELKQGGDKETGAVRKRVTNLVRELDPQTLERLVQMGGNSSNRRRFVLDASQSLAVDSVVRIVKAAASASQQTISHSLTRLLAKLSSQAQAGTDRVRPQADSALRDNVEELIKDWDLKDPNPEDYTLVLDSMARSAPIFLRDPETEKDALTGAHRVVQMSLEVDTWGATVATAVADLIEAGEITYLLRMADEAEAGSQVGARLAEHLISPPQLHRVLSVEDVPEETLRVVVARMGLAAAPVLLDVLSESESRALRRKVFNVLKDLGDQIGPLVLDRLNDRRWYVTRNMLALINALPQRPSRFSAQAYLEHEDARVRREAFPLAVQEDAHRARCLAIGLAETDDRILRMALPSPLPVDTRPGDPPGGRHRGQVFLGWCKAA
jgi:hypothetical protein